MHHLATNSAVNVAVQYRWLGLLRAAYSSPIFTIRDVVALDFVALASDIAAVEDVLQPVAEGLAHLAEFDGCLPSGDPRLSPWDGAAVRILAMKHPGSPTMDDLAVLSRAEKLSASALERRANVLCQPIRPADPNGTYLLGYMLLKAIAARASVDNPTGVGGSPAWPLRTVHILWFVHFYLYEDWVLAALIADPGPVPVTAVADRLTSRLRNLLNCDLGQRVREFIEDVEQRVQRGMLTRGPEEMRHGPFAGSDLTRGEIRLGMNTVDAYYDNRVGPHAPLTGPRPVFGTANDDKRFQNMIAPQPAGPVVDRYFERNPHVPRTDLCELDFIIEVAMRKRTLCTAIDLPVTFRTTASDDLVLTAETEAAELTVAGGGRHLPTRSGSGRVISVLMSTELPWNIYSYLFVGWTIGAVWSVGPPLAPSKQEEMLRVGTALRTELQFKAVSELTLTELGAYLTGEVQQRGTNGPTELITHRIRTLLAEAGWAGVATLQPVRDFGLRSVLKSGAAVRSLSFLGLCNAFTDQREEIERLFAAEGHDLAALISTCNAAATAGVPNLVAIGERTLRARV